MTETHGLPGTRVIAEGDEAVIECLRSLGEPEDCMDLYDCMNLDETEWSDGAWLREHRLVPAGEMWTVTLRGDV